MKMNTTKLITAAVLLLSVGVLAHAQTAPASSPAPAATATPASTNIPVGLPDATKIGVDTAQQALKEVMVTRFEDPGLWSVSMPLDQGLIQARGLPGAPAGRKPIPGEQQLGINVTDNTVLGVKVSFFKRGFDSFSIVPERPLPIEGIVKTLSVWVVGRNANHMLSVIVKGMDGAVAEIPMGTLNFTGWKQLTVAVPPSIVQKDYHYSDRSGIEVLGFVVDTAPLEAYGTYYIYFDDLTAVTDLFSQQQRAPDDMSDGW